MSVAGRRSLQGYSYQAHIALDWVVEMIHQDRDDPIQKISVDSVGFSDSERSPDVDDVVVRFESGVTKYIQAKKNQKDRKHWSLSDSALQSELKKAYTQLQGDENSRVHFYSRDPFGDSQKLADACREQYPNYSIFESEAPSTLKLPLAQLAELLGISEEDAFFLIRRIEFTVTSDFPELERQLRRKLDVIISDADAALAFLAQYLGKHSAGQTSTSRHEVSRSDVVEHLEKKGIVVTPKRSIQDILDSFDSASRIGRSWTRKIDGERIPRKETEMLLEKAHGVEENILVTGRPGSGKTCVLLELADRLEKEQGQASLFIKGDRFCDVSDVSDLSKRGLPEDIPGQCARLAQDRKVVVVIDSLDVLSLNRHHDALKVFLGIIERLSRVSNVTVIAACRTFDKDYDPQLRGVEWDAIVDVDLLDFEQHVHPFLEKWGVDPESVADSLKESLRNPQSLNLYAKIAKRGKAQGVASAYQLQERFLEEIVVKDDTLGEEALEALQEMAAILIDERAHGIPKAQFGGSEAIVQRLISQEVLSEPEDGRLEFAHQTLGDNLAVRKPIAEGNTLRQFIQGHPPFPFIRPSVRSFFFYLRAQDKKRFRREVWKVLDDEDIAYHLRRLVVESLSEIDPAIEDWPLIRRLFTQHPDLFRRFLQRVRSKKWFDHLTEHWLPIALQSNEETPWTRLYIEQLSHLCLEHTSEAVALWQRAFDEDWEDHEEVGYAVIQAIERTEKFSGSAEGVPALLEGIVQALPVDHHSFDYPLGRIISACVEASNQGHEVLLQYMFKGTSVAQDDTSESGSLTPSYRLEANTDFHRDDFLLDCLKTSGEFLAGVINNVIEWGRINRPEFSTSPFNRGELLNTRWDELRSDNDRHFPTGGTPLLYALEDALKYHSVENTEWWQENEPELRESADLGLRYMLIQAYRANPEDNLDGIEAQICDTSLHLYSDMNYELGCLMQEAFPLLSRQACLESQKSVLDLRDKVDLYRDGQSTSWAKIIYDCLNRIPRYYRTVETQRFLDDWEAKFGTARAAPRIRTYGGAVPSPLSLEKLCSLSSESVVRVIRHFDEIPGSFRQKSGGIMGGRRSVVRAVSDAAQIAPHQFLDYAEKWQMSDVDDDFVRAVYRGVAGHCLYRFGNVNPGDSWSPIRPMLSKADLATRLFAVAERSETLWKDPSTARRVVEACCSLVIDEEYANRAILLVFRLLRHGSGLVDNDTSLPDEKVLSNIYRSAAEGAMKLSKQCFELDIEPELLKPLLDWTAQSSGESAQKEMLRWLPYIIRYDQELVWKLLDTVLKGASPELWAKAEKVLYYSYREHFEAVERCLRRLEEEALNEETGEMYGRLLTLSHLAGHVSQDDLFNRLRSGPKSSLKGAAQVFGGNLEHQQTDCSKGSLRLLQMDELHGEAWSALAAKALHKDRVQHVSARLMKEIVSRVPQDVERLHLYNLSDWVAEKSKTDPGVALTVAEEAVAIMESEKRRRFALQSKVMAEATLGILREADEFGDKELARRVLSLQDRLLKMDFRAVDVMLDEASRDW